jgi:hypothetical protein
MNDRPRSLFFPMLLIGAGVLWLLVNLGYIPSTNLWALAHIWPILLIGAGLGLILRQYWAEAGIVVSTLIVLGAVLGVVYAPQVGWDTPPSWPSFAWSWRGDVGGSIGGSRVMESEMRPLDSFSAIQVSYPADITIQQGDANSITITADDNLLPQLRTDVNGGELNIFNGERSWGRRVNASEFVKISIVLQDLRTLSFDSAGSLTVNGYSGDDLEIRLNGAGSITLNEIEVTTLSLRLDGAGSMEAQGAVDTLFVRMDGFGSLNAGRLAAREVTVELDGLGSATVRASELLSVDINGLGSVNYFGSPEVQRSTDGLGTINRSGE